MNAKLGSYLSILLWLVGWLAIIWSGVDLAHGALLSFVQAIWLSSTYQRILELERAQLAQSRDDAEAVRSAFEADRVRETERQMELNETFLRGLLVPDGERQAKVAEMRRLISLRQRGD